MARLRQKFLKPGYYGTAATGLRYLSADDLRRYATDTNAALKSGLPVPLLDEHCPPDGLDNGKSDTFRTRGWLKSIVQNRDESLSYLANVTDDEAAKRIQDKSIKYVSPQLNPVFSKNGHDYGSIIRHLALTPKPVNPDQSEMVLTLTESAKREPFAVSLETYKPNLEPVQMADEKDKENPFDEADPDNTDVTANPENEPADELDTNATIVPENPAEDNGGLGELLMKLVEALGAPVPAGTDLTTPEGQKVAISVMLGKAAGDNEATTESVVEPIEADTQDMSQFSENPVVQQLAEQVKALQAKDAAREHNSRMARLKAQFLSVGFPKHIKDTLTPYLGSVQFAETGKETSRFSFGQVCEIVKKCVPDHILQMTETETIAPEDHDEPQFFSDKDGNSPVTQKQAAEYAKSCDAKKFGFSQPGAVTTVEHVPQPQAIPSKK